MWQRIANSPAKFSVVIVGVLAALTTVLVITAYVSASNAGADSPLWQRFLGGFLSDAWLMAPYVGVGVLAVWLAPSRAASITVLFGSVLIAVGAIWVVTAVLRNPNDGQSGFALAMLPLFQWPTIFLVGIVALIIRRWRGL